MPDPVIIVDASGVEHEFPAGFDPKRAAGIVRYRTQDHPPSAEDFAPPVPSKSIGEHAADAVKSFGVAIGGAAKLAYDATLDPMLHPLRDPREAPFRADLQAMGAASADQARKGVQAFREGRPVEGVARMAGTVPLLGTPAAQIGEQIGEGNFGEAAGNVAAGLAMAKAPAIVPKLPGVARAAGRVGLEGAKLGVPLAIDAAMGMPVTSVRPMLKMIGRFMDRERPAAVPAVEAPPNAGGTLVKAKGPTVETSIADALDEIRNEPAAVGTTPPQPDLPAGYTPRTTVPKSKAAPKPTPKPAAAPSATHGPRNYFVRKTGAAPTEPAPMRMRGRVLTQEDLPTSWRSRTGQALTKPGEISEADVAGVQQVMSESGLSAAEVLDALTRDRKLAPNERTALMDAVNRTGRRR